MTTGKITLFFATLLFAFGCAGSTKEQLLILDMVHHNPGEAFTVSEFNNPEKLRGDGFNGQVINEFQSVHCAINYQKFDPRIFPDGTPERLWVDSLAMRILARIDAAHKAGIKIYYFTDIIVLPKKMKELYASEICDEEGRIDFMKPKTQQIHRAMLDEIFETFPKLDGLVIRVGETYLHNVPYHIGNGPIKRDEAAWKHTRMSNSDGGEATHTALINLLREQVCVKHDKQLIYRTWDFGFFHTNPEYYLTVTNGVEPHKNLIFGIKHVSGDYHRTLPFNKTLGIGNHKQLVEVQAQREYEGKGAYPNYIAAGVIDGFEELKGAEGIKSLRELATSPNFAGVWTWSRGGGWLGPYVKNEFWCDMNAAVLAAWSADPSRSEEEVFMEYAKKRGFDEPNAKILHKIALLSADAVIRGRGSLVASIDVWWTRDQFIGGMEYLQPLFDNAISNNMVQAVLDEKCSSVAIWKEIVALADSLHGDERTIEYVRTSARYGEKLYAIYESAWSTLLTAYEAQRNDKFTPSLVAERIAAYDALWSDYLLFCATAPQCASPYKPYAFVNTPPDFCGEDGLAKSIDAYRAKK